MTLQKLHLIWGEPPTKHLLLDFKKIQNKKTQKKAMGLEKLSEGVKLPQNITLLVSHGDNHGVSGMAVGWRWPF